MKDILDSKWKSENKNAFFIYIFFKYEILMYFTKFLYDILFIKFKKLVSKKMWLAVNHGIRRPRTNIVPKYEATQPSDLPLHYSYDH